MCVSNCNTGIGCGPDQVCTANISTLDSCCPHYICQPVKKICTVACSSNCHVDPVNLGCGPSQVCKADTATLNDCCPVYSCKPKPRKIKKCAPNCHTHPKTHGCAVEGFCKIFDPLPGYESTCANAQCVYPFQPVDPCPPGVFCIRNVTNTDPIPLPTSIPYPVSVPV